MIEHHKGPGMTGQFAVSLRQLADANSTVPKVSRSELAPGDWIIIHTVKSTYRLRKLCDGRFEVSGGWFDRQALSPVAMSVTGCTWGGSAIMTGIVAACGLRIEFGNRLTTSPVQRVVVIPCELMN